MACFEIRKLKEHPPVQAGLIPDPHLSVRIRATWAARFQPARRCYRPQLLAIDEIGRGTEGDWLDGLLLQIVDRRYHAQRVTILIGNVESKALGDVLGA